MRIRPTVQITFGLVMLTSAILLVVDLLFGVFPDPNVQLMQLRKAFAESAATQVAVFLERGDQKTLALALERMREYDPSIRSLAVRRADRTLVAQAGDHKKAWTDPEDGHSTPTELLVPLSSNSAALGQLRDGVFSGSTRCAPTGARPSPLDHPACDSVAGNAGVLAIHPPRPGPFGPQGRDPGARDAGLRHHDRRRGRARQARPGPACQQGVSRAARRRLFGDRRQAALPPALARRRPALRSSRLSMDARHARRKAGHGLRARSRACSRNPQEARGPLRADHRSTGHRARMRGDVR